MLDASPFRVGALDIWYRCRVSAKGLAKGSKGTPDFESGPNLLTLFKAGPYSGSFDASWLALPPGRFENTVAGLEPVSSIAKCNTWGSREGYATLSVYAKTIQTFIPSRT